MPIGGFNCAGYTGEYVDERRKKWNFVLGEDGAWLWRAVGPDGAEESSGGFATLKECTEDATRNGYVVWKTEEERRRAAR